MTAGDLIPDDDHVSRYCSPSRVVNGLPSAASFRLSAKDEGLSVNWPEFFQNLDCEQALERIRQALHAKLTLKPEGRLAVLNVGAAKAAVARAGRAAGLGGGAGICVVHRPEPGDPSHAEIVPPSTIAPMTVAVALQSLVRPEHVHQATPRTA